jgi:hypothetical protein
MSTSAIDRRIIGAIRVETPALFFDVLAVTFGAAAGAFVGACLMAGLLG